MGFSRPEYWGGLPFPSPGDLPNPGIKPGSPALQADSLPAEIPAYIYTHIYIVKSFFYRFGHQFSSVQSLSRVQLFATP